MQGNRYPEVFSFRLTSEAADQLAMIADAYGMQPAVWARQALLRAMDSTMPMPTVRRRVMHRILLRDVLAELLREGNNLNQLVRAINAGGRIPDAIDAVDELKREHAAALRAVVAVLAGDVVP